VLGALSGCDRHAYGCEVMAQDPTGRPFRQFIVKVASGCNLACRYCYVYTMAGQTWRQLPRFLSREVATDAARRIARHVERWRPPSVDVIIHGGEPLLLGHERLAEILGIFRTHVVPLTDTRLALQTNATLLDEPMLDVLAAHEVRVSVSLDGSAWVNDARRAFPSGAGSHERVDEALRLLSTSHAALFAGLLCVVDVDADPVETYESLLRYSPPRIDFLLPHGNWMNVPPGLDAGGVGTPYADWLTVIFERWYGAPVREVGVRILEEIINLLLGGRSGVEGVGHGRTHALVIATDGSINLSDSLAALVPEAARTGLNVAADDFDALLAHPKTRLAQAGREALSGTCLSCRVRDVCGGGLLAHRYHRDTGFDNPSVYCLDLYRLITHVRARLARDLTSLPSKKAVS
jgi:uncharacterized protein